MTLPQVEKITSRHRERAAYVYVRQSTAKQVQQHLESQRNQYALVQRALALGWPSPRIHVIDADLGHSGQDSQRPGFQELVAAVSLGKVGIILAYEASRLARNNTDWYTLIDLATVVGTLLADTEGVYDPRQYNDRLLLGLRGLLSEAELHILHLRMAAGRQRQVERGTYRQSLPTGLLRGADGQVVKDPDHQVRQTLELIFTRFTTLGSCQKVLRSLRDDGVLVPRRQHGGLHAGQVLWRKPTHAALAEILHNPAYAGAFVYGRRGPHPERRPGQARQQRRPLAAWPTIHQEAYPAYISWEQFLANQARLRDNASTFAQRARGTPRHGPALLAGLVVCGRCGYQMHVAYKPQRRYTCTALAASYGAATCLHIDGASLEQAVVAAFFAALAPAELDLLDEVLATQRMDQARLAQYYTDQVTRAEYEARLAHRQYQAVDPDHRLVASELERQWEVALQGVADARAAADRYAHQPPPPQLSPAMRAQLQALSQSLPTLWAQGHFTAAQHKELLRSLIRHVLVARPVPDMVEAKIVWVSGAVTLLQVHPPVLRQTDVQGYAHFVERVLALGHAGYQDREIAQRLTAEGFRGARGPRITRALVGEVRRARGQISLTEQFRTQAKLEGQWTIFGLAQELAVHRNWLYTRIRNGTLPATRHPVLGHYLIPDTPEVMTTLRAQRERCCYR
jgi:DNA invertase Pin-like site-specific DNA recombinase